MRTKVNIIQRDITKIRLSEWRSDKKLCQVAKKILSDENVRVMLEVARNEHLAMQVLPLGVSMETRASAQAMSEGYSICLNNIEAMAIHQPSAKEIEATFEPEERK